MHEELPGKAKEVLAAIAEGQVLQFRQSPRGYFKISSANAKHWARYHRKTLLASLYRLHQHGLVNIAEGLDGVTTVAVTGSGHMALANERQRTIALPSAEEWDQKWRLILFDVPETKKRFREAFRYHLKKNGFAEFQRSAFIFPYPCAEIIDALTERFNLRDHVTLVTAESVSNELQYRKRFGLP